jgi:hypothetical protein
MPIHARDPADATHPIIRLSQDTYVKIILFLILHTATMFGMAWSWTSGIERRIAVLETTMAEQVKILDRIEQHQWNKVDVGQRPVIEVHPKEEQHE